MTDGCLDGSRFPIDLADVAPDREAFRIPLRRCHDWRTYVPDNVAGAWHAFSTEARWVAYMIARAMANREDWE